MEFSLPLLYYKKRKYMWQAAATSNSYCAFTDLQERRIVAGFIIVIAVLKEKRTYVKYFEQQTTPFVWHVKSAPD